MKLTAPTYYTEFHCIADKCKHNCCIGWEVDIDEESLLRYKNIQGGFGNRLAENIVIEDGGASFKLKDDERCPFLNEEGLCDIFTSLGESSLCQICTDHPRFRNYFSNRVEVGLGLCCEAAGRLILGQTEKINLIILENDDMEEELTDEEKKFLDLRTNVFEALQNRLITIDDRVLEMLRLCNSRLPQRTYEQWIDIHLSLERLDHAWDELLYELKNTATAESEFHSHSDYDVIFEQILVYFAYRHLADALDDGRLTERAAFIAHSFYLIRSLCALQIKKFGNLTLEDIVQISRMYSAETEYSEENMETLLTACSVN